MPADTAAPAPDQAPTPADVLRFWFGDSPGAVRPEWFRKDAAFDDRIRQRFGALVDQVLAGPLPATWQADTQARLATLLLLDQFTRNLFRDQARAFAGDAQARTLATHLVDSGADRQLLPVQRWFVYLPFEHAEDLALQTRSVALFQALAADDAAMAGALDYAIRHRDVVARFGRFPHRNAALGRASTAEEEAFLLQPGSRF